MNTSFMQNRELSWLRFNERILEEAADESVPLLERLKFLSIFTGNLDEFFMIRVGGLFDLRFVNADARDSRTGMTPDEQLDKLYAGVHTLMRKRDAVYFELEQKLREAGVCNLRVSELSPEEVLFIRKYYEREIAPILSPQIVDAHHPFPHLQSKALHIGARLEQDGRELFGVIPVPASLPDIVRLPGRGLRYVRVEEIICGKAAEIFSMYRVSEKTVLCITRNADISPNDEACADSLDFRETMQHMLQERRRQRVVRLELNSPVSREFCAYLCAMVNLVPDQVFVSRSPLKLSYAFALAGEGGAQLLYKPFTPCRAAGVENDRLFFQIAKHDILLSYPFESMEPFLRLIEEAASDRQVIAIKISIYRLARKAALAEYLCRAAENGKDVTVLIELRARFDEQNNIDWARRLEDAGCRIIYGFEEYKIHAKVCLIIRKEKDAIRYYTQIGTGNYNERTAAQYTDVSLMTADGRIGHEANAFFRNMALGNPKAEYAHLLVSPVSLKQTVLSLIDEETAKGSAGRILVKINSLTDVDIIKHLQKASCAGVKVELIVRGICCILPGIPGVTENIRVRSIVGRFLEHSRIYVFGEEQKMYIASADFMTRNTERRVEVACPVYSPAVKAKLMHILETALADTVKARQMTADGRYVRIAGCGIDSQAVLLQEAEAAEADVQKQGRGAVRPAFRRFSKGTGTV